MSRSDVETLQLNHQDIAFELECASVRFELCDQLALQAEVQMNGSLSRAIINLNNDYRLMVRPAHPGFSGVSTWFKWHEVTHPSTGEFMIYSQARCVVELELRNKESNDGVSIISFGIEARSMEQLIKAALVKISKLCGLRLVALPETKPVTPINQSHPTKESI